MEAMKQLAALLRPSPKAVMLFFCGANLFNYVDRGIIPGASSEFDSFIQGSHELKGTAQADTWLGLLQSSYIVGYSIASIICGNLIHTMPRFRLVGIGLFVWCTAALVAGLSRGMNSFVVLLLGRVLSGVGEASFQVVATPYIQDHSGDQQGKWLGLYYTAIPLGTALGYIYGASLANSWVTWAGAFIIEAMAMTPMALFCYTVTDDRDQTSEQSKGEGGFAALDGLDFGVGEGDDVYAKDGVGGDELPLAPPVRPHGDSTQQEHGEISLREEALTILRIRIFWLVALGYAGYSATIMGFATFGPAFVMGLGFFDDEQGASFTFGALVSVAGIIGTPLGGFLLDWGKAYIERAENRFYAPLAGGDVDGAIRTADTPLSVRSMSLAQVLALNTVGAAVIFCVVYETNKAVFLSVLGIGITALMAPTAGMNLSVLESVPPENRSLAIGMATLIMHAFGDVPSPIVIGAIKGILAPDCTPEGADSKIPDECDDEQKGLRLTLFLLACWIFWCLLSFALALYFSRLKDQEIAILRQLEISSDGLDDHEEGGGAAARSRITGGLGGSTANALNAPPTRRTSFGTALDDARAESPDIPHDGVSGGGALDQPLLANPFEEA
mmetsp:Transcript_16100/g.49204  ORF Transcript_16100/g.49204 Transcript_16100/m.49204 type:complete len:614 (-) Transcript_16100:327-2168(-)